MLKIVGKSFPTISEASIARSDRSFARKHGLTIAGNAFPTNSNVLLGANVPKETRLTKETRARHVLTGLAKHFHPRKRYMVNGVSMTGDAVAAVYREQLDALDRVERARNALTQAVREERRATRRADWFLYHLKNTVASYCDPDAAMLAEFGWTVPKKPGPKTTRAKATMVEKRRATLAARKASR